MSATKTLFANRGEIAIRIARAATGTELPTVVIYPEDDALSLHLRISDETHKLPDHGAATYLNPSAVIAAAQSTGCAAIHPGYGFLAKNAAFARQCTGAGLRPTRSPANAPPLPSSLRLT